MTIYFANGMPAGAIIEEIGGDPRVINAQCLNGFDAVKIELADGINPEDFGDDYCGHYETDFNTLASML